MTSQVSWPVLHHEHRLPQDPPLIRCDSTISQMPASPAPWPSKESFLPPLIPRPCLGKVFIASPLLTMSFPSGVSCQVSTVVPPCHVVLNSR